MLAKNPGELQFVDETLLMPIFVNSRVNDTSHAPTPLIVEK